MQYLPIDSILPELISALSCAQNLILEAPPGAGKTTRVPPAILDSITQGRNEVWVLEPRRLAVRMAARRVAEERGERLGDAVGYQVRFEEVAGPKTRLRFITEGVLTRRLLSDPLLKNVGVVILDEFHERHLQADLALALLCRLQKSSRQDLKLLVMSATLNSEPVADYLGAAALRSEGKRFEVEIEHIARPDDRPLAEQVEAAVRRLVTEGPKNMDGDVLVFLPGAAEIRRAQAACEPIAVKHGMIVLPLHGDLSSEEQDRVIKPAAQRKLILSTNVAESSVTIDGVAAVIDSGLARIAGHSPWSGLPTLNIERISKASAIQRAGRAGRTRPGRCLRLYTAQDFNARPDHESPEIGRLDLAEPALELHAAGVDDLKLFNWFESPPQSSVEAADTLLKRLGAIDAKGKVTETGQKMLRFPLHPRQSRLLAEGMERGVGPQACLIAALIGERDIVAGDMFKKGGARAKPVKSGPSDLLDRLDLFEEAAGANFSPARLRAMGLDTGAVLSVDRVRRQLEKNLRALNKSGAAANVAVQDPDQSLLISILAGYPDRLAKRRSLKSDNAELLLSSGGSALLSPASIVNQSEYLIAIDAEARRDTGAIVRTASEFKPEWLIDLFFDNLREVTDARWNVQTERVDVVRRLLYDQLVIDEGRGGDADRDAAAKVLSEAALAAGIQKFVDMDAINRYVAQVEFVAGIFPERAIPGFTGEDLEETLTSLCTGLGSFAELRNAAKGGNFIVKLRQRLSVEQSRLISQMAPDYVAISGRRQVQVNYEKGKQPWIESRLQDFFGMKEGPKIAGGRVNLVLHLLAPNRRPVQITTDLAGFWERTYPQVRRELSRRYPRHSWPEKPK